MVKTNIFWDQFNQTYSQNGYHLYVPAIGTELTINRNGKFERYEMIRDMKPVQSTSPNQTTFLSEYDEF